MAKLRVAILISGRGSNMAALIEAAKAADYPAEIALVVSNVADAPGLAIARKEGVPTAVMAHRGQPDRETFDRAVSVELERHGVELVALAGFMRIFSPWFPTRWADRLINIHPSLLPCFKGLHVQQQALDAGGRHRGDAVHAHPAPGTSPLSAGRALVRRGPHRACRRPCGDQRRAAR